MLTLLAISEATPKAGAAIVRKTWAERLNDQPELSSDADEQLLMFIPYGLSILFPLQLISVSPFPYVACKCFHMHWWDFSPDFTRLASIPGKATRQVHY